MKSKKWKVIWLIWGTLILTKKTASGFLGGKDVIKSYLKNVILSGAKDL
jgi:hypothetical protein